MESFEIKENKEKLNEIREKILDNIKNVKERIKRACERSGRNENEIKIVAVSKTFPSDFIKFAYEGGIRDFGENYVQEALKKINELKELKITWHFVGHLQKNKAKFIPGNFEYLHSLDSIELLKELEKRCSAAQKEIKVLVQINIGKEQTKSGIMPENVFEFFEKALEFEPKHVKICGLMVIPPPPKDKEDSRKYFRELMKIKEECARKGVPENMLAEISAGMSDDFEVAIEEGATIVRLGRAIFFERERKK
ncbi:MAG: YggS family pyridoxal phosphate-dependent enzyme [Candidatus Calescibacterium sp.]|jgi:pyridoxal phosphate enzyme (YggS family)|nr:YggS family pyridoxal phosphate-dependent enzyme [Candidatus Calescibacterium sp.]